MFGLFNKPRPDQVEHRCKCGLTFATAQRLATHIQKGNVAYGRGEGVKHGKVVLPSVTEMDLGYLPNWLNRYFAARPI